MTQKKSSSAGQKVTWVLVTQQYIRFITICQGSYSQHVYYTAYVVLFHISTLFYIRKKTARYSCSIPFRISRKSFIHRVHDALLITQLIEHDWEPCKKRSKSYHKESSNRLHDDILWFWLDPKCDNKETRTQKHTDKKYPEGHYFNVAW